MKIKTKKQYIYIYIIDEGLEFVIYFTLLMEIKACRPTTDSF